MAPVFEDGQVTPGGERFRLALRFLTEPREPVTAKGTFGLRDDADGMVAQAFDGEPARGHR